MLIILLVTNQRCIISIHQNAKTLMTVGRSLMYNKNNRGPMTEPWGFLEIFRRFSEQIPEKPFQKIISKKYNSTPDTL